MAGFQNNPLTKFPLNNHAPGVSSQQAPGRQPPVITHSPIGPTVANTSPQRQLTPPTSRVQFKGFKSPLHK